MKKLILAEFFVLLLGTLFAWTNFGIEFYSWYNQVSCAVGCSAGKIVNPFLTSCFYGAIFFTAAFVLSALILQKSKKVK